MVNPLKIQTICHTLLRAAAILTAALDSFRNLEHDIGEAREHVLAFDENFDDYKFQTTRYRNFPLSLLGKYDDYDPWLEIGPDELKGLSREELFEALRKFRGRPWAEKAMQWLSGDGIPAIVIIQTPEFTGVADGRGRVTLALGLGLKTLPAVIMKAGLLPHQTQLV